MTQIIHAITMLASQWTLFIVEYQCKPRQFLIVPGEVLHGFKSHRISHCLFCLVPVTSTFVSNTNLHLVPSFTRSIFAITSGCMLQELAFSRACAQTRGFCTVQNLCLSYIPVWWSCSTQSSILSPRPPPLKFDICHLACFSTYALWGWSCIGEHSSPPSLPEHKISKLLSWVQCLCSQKCCIPQQNRSLTKMQAHCMNICIQ